MFITPISRDFKEGRFLISKSPPKSLKLDSPIWIDCKCLQFKIWNDFDPSFPKLLVPLVNDFEPILTEFSEFSPLSWNTEATSKHWFSISIVLRKGLKLNRKPAILLFLNDFAVYVV